MEAYLEAVKRHARLLEQLGQTGTEDAEWSVPEAEWQITVARTKFLAHRNEAHPKT